MQSNWLIWRNWRPALAAAAFMAKVASAKSGRASQTILEIRPEQVTVPHRAECLPGRLANRVGGEAYAPIA